MSTTALLRGIWVAAGLALLLGWVRERVLGALPSPRLLARVEANAGSPWLNGGFRLGGAYVGTEAGLLPPQVPHAGSWLDGDAWEGEAATEWFQVTSRVVRIGVAGYPQLPGCKLRAEFRRAAGAVTSIACPIPNPRERWNIWSVDPPHDATAVRLIAEDRTGGHGGWIAFSHPFESSAGPLTAAYHFLQIATTTARALTLIWGPGLAGIARAAQPRVSTADGATRLTAVASEWQTLILIGSGPLLLASFGTAIWCAGGVVPPATFARGLAVATWLALGRALWRHGFRPPLPAAAFRVLGVTALVTTAVVARSFHSVGPPGELFRGTVSRNFEMADRIDSRYSFYVVQAAAHHWAPASPQAEKFFFPWTFFSRGPLAGLATTPLVLATGGKPPTVFPEARWLPYDATGFAAYRITMIALAGTVIVALFLVLLPLAGEAWAAIAAGLLALSPFGVHEMLFTWPKWAATAWLIASFGLAHARRPLGAGLALGVGFMFHPLVLLWAPWLALWAAGRMPRSFAAMSGALGKIAAGTAVIVVPWMTIGALMPHLSTTPLPGQVGFLRYWTRADWKIATWDTWWSTRWMNFANTFVPLHGYLAEASFNHPKLNSAYEASGRLVRFSQLWWNSLPFAMGLGLWLISLAALWRAARHMLAAVGLLVIAPTVFITAYWGMDPLGLMRECGHPLFVTLIGLTCLAAAHTAGGIRRWLAHPLAPWLQLPETWLMLWLTSRSNPAPWSAEFNHLDGLYLLLNALLLLAAAWIVTRARIEPKFAPATRVAASAPRPSQA